MKKTLFILLSCLVVTGVWIGIRSQQAAPAKPTLLLVGMALDAYGRDAYEFEVSNPTTQDLVFLGLDATSPKLCYQIWTPAGWVTPPDLSRGCPTGLSKQVLPAGGKFRFIQSRIIDETVRRGIVLGPDSSWNGTYRPLAWLPKSLPKWAADWRDGYLERYREGFITWSVRLDRIPETITEAMVEEFILKGAIMDEPNTRIEKSWLYEPPFTTTITAPPNPFAAPRPIQSLPQGADPFAPPAASTTNPFASTSASTSTSP